VRADVALLVLALCALAAAFASGAAWQASGTARIGAAHASALIGGAAMSLLLSWLCGQRAAALRAEQAERDCAVDRALLNGMVASAMDAIVSVNDEHRIVIFNAAAEAMFGRPAQAMIGRPLDELLPARHRHAHAGRLEVFRRDGMTIQRMGRPGRVFGMRADGTEFPIEASISKTQALGRQLATVIMRDVSERLRNEEDLRRHRDHLHEMVKERTAECHAALVQAEASNRAKSRFLANMSHELRTPMHAILSFSDLGRKRATSADPDRIVSYFESIRSSGRRLKDLIDDLLDLAKLEAGRTSLEVSELRMKEIVRDALSRFEPQLRERGLGAEVRCMVADDTLAADAGRIRQVLHHLLANAVKVTPAGGVVHVEIEDTVLPASTDPARARVPALRTSVVDQGAGIPAGELEAVFGNFVQGSAAATGTGGAGLGLALCREIVALHGGRLRAFNRYDGGAVLEFVLPRARARDGDSEASVLPPLTEQS
jgi:PAS domain S-box-containing protein